MKKILFAFASLALIQSANAADSADVKWNAEMRFRYTDTQNSDMTKKSYDGATAQRSKIGATFTKGEDLTATVTLMNASTWGNAGVNNTSGDMTADGDQVTYVSEAFVFWKAMDNFAVKIGKGALDLADGTVVAKNDWQQTPYAFEGASGVYFTEWANVNVFGVKGMNDEDAPSANTADVNFYGASLDFKNLPEALKMLNFHVLQSKATGISVADAKDSKTRYGLTAKGDVAGFDFRATYAMYSGELEVLAAPVQTVDNKGSMLDAEVGYGLPDMMNLHLSVAYHSDSGDSTPGAGTATGSQETYDPFFYDKHANAGMMDIIGWGNSTYIKVGAAVEPMEMTKVGLDYYMFSKTEKNDAVYREGVGGLGTAYAGSAATAKDDVGSEIDLWATKALSNGTELNARIGQFDGGDGIGANLEKVTQASLGATFHF